MSFELLLESLLKGGMKVKESGSKTFLVNTLQSQSSESINESPTATQDEAISPEEVTQLLTKLRTKKRTDLSYQPIQYTQSNVVEIQIWTEGFVIIRIPGQEISICNYNCIPEDDPNYTVKLLGLDVNKISNKIEPSIRGNLWRNFSKYDFKANNETANGAFLAYYILKPAGIDKILEFNCCEVDIKTINMHTLIKILSLAKKTEDEDFPERIMLSEAALPKKRSMDDALLNLILISMITNGIIDAPKLSQPDWELSTHHEDLQGYLSLNYPGVNSAELNEWFEKNYNLKSDETAMQRILIIANRNELIQIVEEMQERKNQKVAHPLIDSQVKKANTGNSNHHKKGKCLIM
jgi:hypothetical protein